MKLATPEKQIVRDYMRRQPQHFAGYAITEGGPWRSCCIAPLCGDRGALSVRVFQKILPHRFMGETADLFADPKRLNGHEFLSEVQVIEPNAGWCQRCVWLSDELEESMADTLLVRMPVVAWMGRGGSALSAFDAEDYFANGRSRVRENWAFVAWLQPAVRIAAMRSKMGAT